MVFATRKKTETPAIGVLSGPSYRPPPLIPPEIDEVAARRAVAKRVINAMEVKMKKLNRRAAAHRSRRQKNKNKRRGCERPSVILNRENVHDKPPSDLGLSEEFLAGVNWRPPVNSKEFCESDEDRVVMMIRPPQERLEVGLANRFVAINRRLYKGSQAEVRTRTHRRFWNARLNAIQHRLPTDILKSGLVIWRHLDLHVSINKTAAILGLQAMDAETADAAQSALFSAFNTSAALPDMETVAFALGTFIHAHPIFSNMISNGEFYLPFGPDTGFKLLKPHGFGFD